MDFFSEESGLRVDLGCQNQIIQTTFEFVFQAFGFLVGDIAKVSISGICVRYAVYMGSGWGPRGRSHMPNGG